MGTFSRSWELTKSTLSVMKKDKEIFAFPVLAIVTSFIFLLLFLIFTFFFGSASFAGGLEVPIIGYILLFGLYLGLAVISTFFSVCVVYTAGIRFSGKDATFGDSISFGFKRFPKILLWGILSATVGLIFSILDNIARKSKGAGKIVLAISNYLLGAAWAISTIFVVQGIVYKNLGPFASIKESIATLKKTWGESLVRYVGFGVAEFILVLIGLFIFVPLIVLSFMYSLIIITLISIIGLIVYLVSLTIFFNISESVFNTALYIYSNSGKTPEGFSEEQMKETFKQESKKPFGILG